MSAQDCISDRRQRLSTVIWKGYNHHSPCITFGLLQLNVSHLAQTSQRHIKPWCVAHASIATCRSRAAVGFHYVSHFLLIHFWSSWDQGILWSTKTVAAQLSADPTSISKQQPFPLFGSAASPAYACSSAVETSPSLLKHGKCTPLSIGMLRHIHQHRIGRHSNLRPWTTIISSS